MTAGMTQRRGKNASESVVWPGKAGKKQAWLGGMKILGLWTQNARKYREVYWERIGAHTRSAGYRLSSGRSTRRDTGR
jgi:hypothetical protein